MAERVLCEMKKCEWTGIEYPTPYSGNCFYTSDSKALQDFKKEVLAECPEMKGRLRIVSVKTMQDKQAKLAAARERSRAYLEWRAYQSTRW